jgi:hypothetical protein
MVRQAALHQRVRMLGWLKISSGFKRNVAKPICALSGAASGAERIRCVKVLERFVAKRH